MFSLFILLIGCSNESAEDQTEKSALSISLREVEVVEENLQVHVKGEVRSSEDKFYYTVEQGQDKIIEEQTISLDANGEEWVSFEFDIHLKEEIMESDDVPFITFYAKNNSDLVNPNYVPIEIKDS